MEKELKQQLFIDIVKTLSRQGLKSGDHFSFICINDQVNLFTPYDCKQFNSSLDTDTTKNLLQDLIDSDYEGVYSKQGLEKFFDYFLADENSLHIFNDIKHSLSLYQVKDLNFHNECALKIFDLETKTYYPITRMPNSENLVKNLLEQGFEPERVQRSNNHRELSWITDLAACALIKVEKNAFDNYTYTAINDYCDNYLLATREIIKSLRLPIDLFQTNKELYVPKKLISQKYSLPEKNNLDLLDILFHEDIMKIDPDERVLDNQNYAKMVADICGKLNIPTKRKVEVLYHLFGENRPFHKNIFPTLSKFYNDANLKVVLEAIIDTPNFIQDVKSQNIALNLSQQNLNKLSKSFPETYHFFEKTLPLKNITQAKIKHTK